MSLSFALLCGADKTRVRLPDWERFLFPRRVFCNILRLTAYTMPFWYGALSPARDYFLHETLRTPGYPSDREHDREILFCVENLLRHPDHCRPLSFALRVPLVLL